MQDRARELAGTLEAGLRKLVGQGVVEVRTRGLWAGIDVEPALMSGRELCERMLVKGVLVKDTHGSTIRLAPPLVIAQEDLEWMTEQFGKVLAEA
jgi:ornithine--oxo-acid transaminase